MYCTAQEIKLIFYNNYKWSMICKNLKSLHCTPETNLVHELYLNQKIKKKKGISFLSNSFDPCWLVCSLFLCDTPQVCSRERL